MEVFSELYYGIWSQISLLPQIARAAIVLGILFICLWILLVILFPKLIVIIFRILKKICKIFYLLLSDYLLPIFFRKKYIDAANHFSQNMEKITNNINKLIERLKSRKKLHLGKLIIIYGSVLLLIYLPNLLADVISTEYIDIISYASSCYSKLEEQPLKKAKKYAPIFVVQETEFSTQEDETLVEIKIIKDVNFREGPGKSYDSMKVLYEDTIVYFIEKSENGNWYHIKTKDGLEGWIHKDYARTN